MAQVTRAALASSVATLLADNSSGDISAGDMRSLFTDLEDSAHWYDEAPISHNHAASEITSGTLPVARGGTGGGTASAARTALGLVIGTDVQAYDANLPAWPSTVDATEVGYLNGVTSAIQTQIDGKSSTSHTHTHADVTDYDTELAGKTNTTAFTPTADYHPATKKYVDDNGGGGSWTGVSSGAGAPGTTPGGIGYIYIDTTNDNAYIATGTASSADWTLATELASGSKINDLTAVAITGTDELVYGDVSDSNNAKKRGVNDAMNDLKVIRADTTDTLEVGFAATDYNAGTQSSGTFTPDEADGNFQYAVNGGAHTLAPPTNSGSIVVQYTNNASAGAITTSGFTIVTGDSFTTTNGDDFMCVITKCNAFSVLNVTAMQ